MEGLISKKGEFKPKCDKPNMALSQIWDKTKHGLRDWIISYLVRAFTVWEKEQEVGVEFFISWCSLFKKEEMKKRKP